MTVPLYVIASDRTSQRPSHGWTMLRMVTSNVRDHHSSRRVAECESTSTRRPEGLEPCATVTKSRWIPAAFVLPAFSPCTLRKFTSQPLPTYQRNVHETVCRKSVIQHR